MKGLYQSPLRVYLALFCLAMWGVLSGMQLPVSLFPNSSKPEIAVSYNYGGLSADEFIRSYGHDIESRLKAATFDNHEVDEVTARYQRTNVRYKVIYKWGTPGPDALREVESVANSFAARLPEEIRDSQGVWTNSENSGFLGVSFYSETRSLDELYKYLEPIFTPKLAKVTEASGAGLWNPNEQEVRIELNPEKLALLQLTPSMVSTAIRPGLAAYGGGSVMVGLNNLGISMQRPINSLEDLARLPIGTPTGQFVHLSDVAKIDFGLNSSQQRIIKTSGAASLILFADPRPGGNIKKMAEDVMAIVHELEPTFPEDIKYKVLVDPSEFIRSATNNVVHEVFLAAFLAVIVLFVFIGNIRNVITAAIEIPVSIILAFIFMKFFGINLNLISLGGLALSAGMNVDASVVVMENIFRRFEEWKGPMTPMQRVNLVVEAVDEVRFPVIASTIASVVVFLPLAMTQGLTNAILGDLALAVVFSHGCSAFVALILVPTVRLQMMSMEKGQSIGHSPIERHLKKMEDLYAKGLHIFINNPRIKYATYSAICASLALLIALVLPRLPREIIGTPDTDWIYFGVSTSGNTVARQMDEQAGEIEAKILEKFGSEILYTFTQVHSPNNAGIMTRLKDKSKMKEIQKALEAEFPNTPLLSFFVDQWNPSELPIPNPSAMTLVVRGKEQKDRVRLADEIKDALNEAQIYDRLNSRPGTEHTEMIVLKPSAEQWAAMQSARSPIDISDVADLARVSTEGRRIGSMPLDGRTTDITIQFPENRVKSVEDLSALPIGLGGKIVPLNALAKVTIETVQPERYREDGRDLVRIWGTVKEEDKPKKDEFNIRAEQVVSNFMAKNEKQNAGMTVIFEDAAKELTEALRQLGWAIALSVLLIFLTMVFQFGDIPSALLVLVSVPLGFIGVLASLFIFGSTLSLNSALGVILLNGISVANSIILVDFLKRLVEQGVPPALAALQAARKRMRPILMTSLTTGLGMMPIAIGMGEGGKILQPLGIAVIGGLGFSMLTTLFVVPSLQVAYLEWRMFRKMNAMVPASDMSDGISVTDEPFIKPSLGATVREHEA